MKHTRNIFLVSLLFAGLEFAWTGCVGPGDGGGVVYGGVYGGGPWYQDGVWVDGGGRGWYGGHRDAAYAHPAGRPAARAVGHAAPSGGHAAPSGGGHGGGGDHR